MTPGSEPTDSPTASDDQEQKIVEAISTRAYHLWENAGRPEGRDDDFWFQAEAEYSEQAKS